MEGRGLPDVRDFIQYSGAGSTTLRVGDVGDVPTYWKDDGQMLPLGDMPIYGAAAKTVGV